MAKLSHAPVWQFQERTLNGVKFSLAQALTKSTTHRRMQHTSPIKQAKSSIACIRGEGFLSVNTRNITLSTSIQTIQARTYHSAQNMLTSVTHLRVAISRCRSKAHTSLQPWQRVMHNGLSTRSLHTGVSVDSIYGSAHVRVSERAVCGTSRAPGTAWALTYTHSHAHSHTHRPLGAPRRTLATDSGNTPTGTAETPVPVSLIHKLPTKRGKVDIGTFPVERIRNFSIIAHVDHGKSTLADRLLEMTGVLAGHANKQFLDKLKVEKERGITVKAQSSTLFYTHPETGVEYMINLIDTPGHVDFSYEVSRSLAACQGTILLVDAAQGIQAQTVANFFLAFQNDLEIITCLNKVDLQHVDLPAVYASVLNVFGAEEDEVLKLSAKTGVGCDTVLPAVVDRMPCPKGDREKPLRALLFDSWFDEYKGVVCLLELMDGILKPGDKIESAHSGRSYEILDLGILHPETTPTQALYAGQVGYIVTGMKTTKEARVGDTFFALGERGEPLPGFKEAKALVFAGIYPMDSSEHDSMRSAIEKLTLNDAGVTVAKTRSSALGFGWRLGFLGLLHMEVFQQRLEEDYGANVVVTAPNVAYKAKLVDGTDVVVESPEQFPANQKLDYIEEPMVMGTLIFPAEYIGKMLNLCETRRGTQHDMSYIDETRVSLRYVLPTAEIITDFYDEVKSISAGYASFDYEDHGYEKAPIKKLEIILNGEPVDALSSIVHTQSALRIGKRLTQKLAETLSRGLFDIIIQASMDNKVLARETLKAYRKQVLAKCYGGDVSRKRKLLEKQKAGKKRMKMIGNVEVPKEAFLSLVKK